MKNDRITIQKNNAIVNVFQTISGLIIILVVFLPWIQIRFASLKSVYILCAEHITTNSMSYSYMIGDYLQRFEITTGYTSSFANDEGLIRCDPEHIFYFKKFCDNINTDAVLRPYRYYLGHNQTGACQLEYYSYENNTNQPNNDIFKLFYVFPYNKTHDMIRVYNETVDFKNWNYFTDGEFVDFIDAFSSNINFKIERMLFEPYWNTGLADFGSQNESRVFTINYPILGKYDPKNDRLNGIVHNNKTKNIMKKSKKDIIIKQNKNPLIKNDEKINLKFKKNSLLRPIQKIKESFNRFETRIIRYFLDFHKNNQYFARSIEEANEKIRLINKITKEIQEIDNDTIIVTDVGSSFFTESLYNILKQKKHDKFSRYIITDYMYNVLIDNEMGAIYPKYFENGMSVFPNISDINNSIWNSVEKEIINVPIDVPLLVNLSLSIQYMLMKRIIHTRSRYSFYLIMLFEINPKINTIYSMITYVFVICVLFLMIVYFIMKISIYYTDSKYNNKLKNKQKIIINNNYNNDGSLINDDNIKISKSTNLYKGILTKAIQKLRIFQLMNSEDIKLNNLIDSSIEEMTKNEEYLFNVEIENLSCPFCSYLIDCKQDLTFLKYKNDEIQKNREKKQFRENRILNYYLKDNKSNHKENEMNKNNNYYENEHIKNDKLFSIWIIKMNPIIYKSIDDNLLESNPHKYLIQKFIKFIHKRNLLFPEIYPDSLFSFIIFFTKENICSYHCKIKSFLLLKKLIKFNFKFWINSKIGIFTLFLSSILRNSKIQKADEIICIFNSFVYIQNDYFSALLKALIDGTNKNQVMKIYGSLLNRIQSPNFSVQNDIKDSVLFMKSLLTFIDFAPYLNEYELNEKCFNEIDDEVFTVDEKENSSFISNFHYEMSKNIVLPWLNLMNSISPNGTIENTLQENINLWYEKMNCS